jgi:hypothetical protein
MIDKILVLLSSLMLAVLITLGFLDYQKEFDALIAIISLSGFILAVYNFIKIKK